MKGHHGIYHGMEDLADFADLRQTQRVMSSTDAAAQILAV